MKNIIALALIASCTAALAKDPAPKPEPAKPATVSESQAQAIAAAVALAVQKQMQEQYQYQSALAYGGSSSVNVAAPGRIPVATATAPGLTSSGASDINGTCFGSSSAGAQAPGLGVTFGTTWQDDGCDMRYDFYALRAAGHHKAANERLCQKPAIAKAMEAAGTPCAPKKASQTNTRNAEYTGSDPIVKARLGIAE